MKPDEALNLLGAIPCTKEDKKRERIGNIRLLGIVIKGMGNKEFISDEEKFKIKFHLYESIDQIKNNDFDLSEYASYMLAVLYFVLHLLPFVFIYLVAEFFETQIGSLFMGLWYVMSIASYLYLLLTKIHDDKYIFQIKKMFQRFYLQKLKKMKKKFENFSSL
jgi:hypothetical protein